MLTSTSNIYCTHYNYPPPIKHCQGTDIIYEADNSVLETVHAVLLYSSLVLFLQETSGQLCSTLQRRADEKLLTLFNHLLICQDWSVMVT